MQSLHGQGQLQQPPLVLFCTSRLNPPSSMRIDSARECAHCAVFVIALRGAPIPFFGASIAFVYRCRTSEHGVISPTYAEWNRSQLKSAIIEQPSRSDMRGMLAPGSRASKSRSGTLVPTT